MISDFWWNRAGAYEKHTWRGDFKQRKAQRKAWLLNYVIGWRQRPCGCCSGSGYYDHNGSPKCGGCSGTGREWYCGPKSPVGKGGDPA